MRKVGETYTKQGIYLQTMYKKALF
jgi:hypothetical protein